MNANSNELETDAEYYERRFDRVIVPVAALDSEVYFRESATGARFRYGRDDVDELLDDGGLVRVGADAEVLA